VWFRALFWKLVREYLGAISARPSRILVCGPRTNRGLELLGTPWPRRYWAAAICDALRHERSLFSRPQKQWLYERPRRTVSRLVRTHSRPVGAVVSVVPAGEKSDGRHLQNMIFGHNYNFSEHFWSLRPSCPVLRSEGQCEKSFKFFCLQKYEVSNLILNTESRCGTATFCCLF
jgi:hypothetical protein